MHHGEKMAFGSLEAIRDLATVHAEASLEEVFFAVTEKTGNSAALIEAS
jgi:hypothetical protein